MKKIKICRSIMCLTLSFSLILTDYLTADADRSVSTIQKDVNNVQDEIDDLDEDLYAVVLQIEEFSQEIADLEVEIADTQQDLEDVTAALNEQYASMKVRIQYMYEAQNEGMLAMLLGSGSVTEFLNKVEYVNDVYIYDRDKLDQFKAIQEEMQELEDALEIQNEELTEAKAGYEEQQEALQTMLDEKQSELSDLQTELTKAKEKAKKEAERKKKEAAAKRAAERAAKEKAAAEKAAAEAAAKESASSESSSDDSNSSDSTNSDSSSSETTSSSSSDSSSSYGEIGGDLNPEQSTGISGSDVVSYACQFVGNPYVWGGTSLTNGCDCSGFVQAVYSNFGITWGTRMTSASFRSVGQEVSYDYMQAGDIVCYSGHVGIYMGNGCIVEAQSVRTGITCNRSVDCRTIITIRRVL